MKTKTIEPNQKIVIKEWCLKKHPEKADRYALAVKDVENQIYMTSVPYYYNYQVARNVLQNMRYLNYQLAYQAEFSYSYWGMDW